MLTTWSRLRRSCLIRDIRFRATRNSDAIEIGDFVLAVGSPFGLSHSITFGIVSATGRWDLKLGEGVKYQHFYLRGTATGEIVGFAEKYGVDLIVMASHGRTGLRRLLMGSTAENVMRQAPCPVLIVKQPSTAERQQENEDLKHHPTQAASNG